MNPNFMLAYGLGYFIALLLSGGMTSDTRLWYTLTTGIVCGVLSDSGLVPRLFPKKRKNPPGG